MNDQAQPNKRAPSRQTRSAGRDQHDARPQADPVLTERHERLDEALNGPAPATGQGALNWSGVDETAKVFDSLVDELIKAIAVERPTSDLPQRYDDQSRS